MKIEILKKVKEAKDVLCLFESYSEFSFWLISHIGIGEPKDIKYFHQVLKSIGIDIEDFPMETSFTLHEMLDTMKKMSEKGQI